MSGTPPNKLAVPLAPLLPRLELDGECAALLANLADAAAGLQALLAARRLPEAMRLVAHSFPKREAVWWACMCARAVPPPEAAAADMAALVAAEGWVRRPDEPARRAAMEAAQKTGFRTTEAWAAVGAFWSGGSMAPEGQPVVPPGEHLTGTAIGGAVVLAGVRRAPQHMDARMKRFLASAREIAQGGAGRIPPEA